MLVCPNWCVAISADEIINYNFKFRSLWQKHLGQSRKPRFSAYYTESKLPIQLPNQCWLHVEGDSPTSVHPLGFILFVWCGEWSKLFLWLCGGDECGLAGKHTPVCDIPVACLLITSLCHCLITSLLKQCTITVTVSLHHCWNNTPSCMTPPLGSGVV